MPKLPIAILAGVRAAPPWPIAALQMAQLPDDSESRLHRRSSVIAGSGALLMDAGLLVTLGVISYRDPSALDPIKTGSFLVGIVALTFLGMVALIPSWGEAVAKGLDYVRFQRGNTSFGWGREGQQEPWSEKPPPPADKGKEEQVESLQERLDPKGILQDVAESDPDLLWRTAAHYAQHKEYHQARRLIDMALEVEPENPSYLISSGHLWDRLEDLDKAVTADEKAIQLMTDNGETDTERYYLAHSNLAFHLADRGRPENKERALAVGALAAGVVDRFENRNPFVINYGFAQVVFAEDLEETAEAVCYLSELHKRELKAHERKEVSDYIEQGLTKLHGLTGVSVVN